MFLGRCKTFGHKFWKVKDGCIICEWCGVGILSVMKEMGLNNGEIVHPYMEDKEKIAPSEENGCS